MLKMEIQLYYYTGGTSELKAPVEVMGSEEGFKGMGGEGRMG